jgi:hypothetical protein
LSLLQRGIPTIRSYAERPAHPARLQGGYRLRDGGPAALGVETQRITIITVTLNAAADLETTLASVAEQRCPDFEHIVIDGGSRDNTVEVLRRHDNDIALWISEPDGGIYDAMNKGIAAARGAWIGMLNAGTVFHAPDVLAAVQRAGSSGAPDVVYGDMIYIQGDVNEPVYARSGLELLREMRLCHEATFVSRAAYDRYGLYDASYRIAADYELCLRLLMRGASFVSLGRPCVTVWSGGVSDTRLLETSAESVRLLLHHGGVRPALAFAAIQGRRACVRAAFWLLQRTAGKAAHDRLRRRYVATKQLLARYRPR